jgi:hypothetical protein
MVIKFAIGLINLYEALRSPFFWRYGAASLGDWCPTFRGTVVVSSSRVGMYNLWTLRPLKMRSRTPETQWRSGIYQKKQVSTDISENLSFTKPCSDSKRKQGGHTLALPYNLKTYEHVLFSHRHYHGIVHGPHYLMTVSHVY